MFQKKFLADAMLGKLAKWLRILGYDTLYLRDSTPEKLRRAASGEGRLVLTRNSKLEEKDFPAGFYFIHHDRLKDQLRELISSLNLTIDINNVFTRCSVCNGELAPLAPEQAVGRVPEFVWRNHENFRECIVCKHVYWPGSHLSRVEAKILEDL
jgi:uncharacterized protein with PIN domain